MKNKRIIIFTDAWYPQINGVVTTLNHVSLQSEIMGYECIKIHPNLFNLQFSLPTYPDIKITIATRKQIINIIRNMRPDYIHIATEGPIGFAASSACKKLKIPFTTSYHTKFPEYVNTRFPAIKQKWVYKYLKTIHNKAENVLVTTKSMVHTLENHGFDRKRMKIWGRGVNTELFSYSAGMPANVLLYVGRISIEKNLEAFLNIKTDMKKRVVGDGPDLEKLKEKYKSDSSITFVGKKIGEELVREYQKARVFVFPSKTDTFGIVQLESMACGAPVAAYNVTGPKDIITPGVNGYFCDNLETSIEKCLEIDRKKCSESVQHLSWESIAETFVESLVRINKNSL